ncbi:flavin reductase family protein [Modestobacter sp. NPDC049651]|uniref:flavin reductase family protein n=1 Tax=unclassified Modestobacter TaxID=2643866 RepID=UPI003404D914
MTADPSARADVPAQVIDPRAMRDVLGHFATGVTVVTAAGPDGPLGFTCQSFSSLSLEPALVAFAPARTSSTWPKVREVGTFCVNVLAESQAELSGQFARSGTDKYAGVSWVPSPLGSPVLDDVVAWIDCTLEAEHDGGDHTIVVGRVLDLGADPSRPPLLFHRGGYGLRPVEG